jgi:hypothetical protein
MAIDVEYLEVGDLLKVKDTQEIKEVSEIDSDYIIMSDNTTYLMDELEDVTLDEMKQFSEREYWNKHERPYGDFHVGDIIKYNGDVLVIGSIEELMQVKFVVCTNGRTIFDTINIKIDTFVELRRKDEEF